jgi:hypothetical protein
MAPEPILVVEGRSAWVAFIASLREELRDPPRALRRSGPPPRRKQKRCGRKVRTRTERPRQSARLMVTRRDCSVVRGGGSWSVDGIVNVIESVEAAREPRARAPNSMTALCGHEVDWRGPVGRMASGARQRF